MTEEIKISEEAQLHASLLGGLGQAISRSVPETGIAMLRRALGCNPRDAAHYLALASALIVAGEDEEPRTLIERVMSENKNIAPAWQMLGVLATNRGDLDEAIDCFKRAHELAPHHGQTKFDLGCAYLRAGRWIEGWPFYRSRHEILPKTGPLPDAPLWTGEKTGHLAVWGDQGHGDRFQFARFLPWARERAAKVTLLTNAETIPLLYGYRDTIGGEITSLYDPATLKFDHHVCIADLPMLYGCTPDNVPPDPGLLSPARTTDRLAAVGLKIGIAWAGNPEHPNDSIRSMRFADLLPLASDPRNTLYSLQCGPPAAEITTMRAQRIVHDMSGIIDGEFAHTAALIGNLDLVVTVDTAVAHIAGCMRVPCFLMVPRFCDWRWLWDREDTPWYPSLRIFRQPKPGDWKRVVANVMAAIRELHHHRAVVRLTNAHLKAVHAPGAADAKEPDVAAVIRKVLRQGDTFIDVGANIGMHTTLAATIVGPGGRVLAVEPGSNNLPTLCEQVKNLPQVEVLAQPLWRAAEEVRFHLCAEGGGGDALWDPGKFPTNALSREKPASSLMQATTLDVELEKRALKPCLIKIDTEGAEEQILRGAAAVLFEHKPPFIVAEMHEFGLGQFGGSQQSLRALMKGFGYDTFTIFPGGEKPFRVPDDAAIGTPMIINLLFSTQAEVDEAWPNQVEGDPRHIKVQGYVAGAAQQASAA